MCCFVVHQHFSACHFLWNNFLDFAQTSHVWFVGSPNVVQTWSHVFIEWKYIATFAEEVKIFTNASSYTCITLQPLNLLENYTNIPILPGMRSVGVMTHTRCAHYVTKTSAVPTGSCRMSASTRGWPTCLTIRLRCSTPCLCPSGVGEMFCDLVNVVNASFSC